MYSTFFWIYKIAHIVGLVGLFFGLLHFIGVFYFLDKYTPRLIKQLMNSWLMEVFFPSYQILIFYSLYFSILVRDITELCAETMTNAIEHSINKFYSTNINYVCNICGTEFEDDDTFVDEEGRKPTTISSIINRKRKIQCGHCFHEFCIRGWVNSLFYY